MVKFQSDILGESNEEEFLYYRHISICFFDIFYVTAS